LEDWRVERVKVLFGEKVADIGGGKIGNSTTVHF
jgi:hypothetical protein